MREKVFRRILRRIEYKDVKPVRLLEVRILQGLAKRSFGMQGNSAEIITDISLSDDPRTGALPRSRTNPLKRFTTGNAVSAPLRNLDPGNALSAPLKYLDPGNALSAPLKYLDPGKALRKYAEFTTACMELLGSGETIGEENSDRLYQDAYRLGSIFRKVTGFRERADLDRLIFYLYRNIDIDMSGSTGSELIVSDCYFSNFYTPEQCMMMSNVDSGIIAGICGGGHLEFTERITEGCERCRACFAGNAESE